MYPSSLTTLARANPFSAPLFSLQRNDDPPRGREPPRSRSLAAAAAADGESAEPRPRARRCVFQVRPAEDGGRTNGSGLIRTDPDPRRLGSCLTQTA